MMPCKRRSNCIGCSSYIFSEPSIFGSELHCAEGYDVMKAKFNVGDIVYYEHTPLLIHNIIISDGVIAYECERLDHQDEILFIFNEKVLSRDEVK